MTEGPLIGIHPELPENNGITALSTRVNLTGTEEINPVNQQKDYKDTEITVDRLACLSKLRESFGKTVEDYYQELKDKRETKRVKLFRVKNFFLKDEVKERVMAIYENLLPEGQQITLERQSLLVSHLDFVLRRGIDQDLDNPENYVSHGFTHTLNVIRYINQIIEAHPDIIKKLEDQYQISPEQARFILENVGLFHDFGYPESELNHMQKVVHSRTGADVINHGMAILNGKEVPIKEVLANIFEVENKSEIVRDIRNAVLMHNADKNDQDYTARIETDQGNFLVEEDYLLRSCLRFGVTKISIYAKDEIEGKKSKQELLKSLTGFLPEDKKMPDVITVKEKYLGRRLGKDDHLGLEFFKVSLLDDPLLGVIRLADNMDMTPERFSAVQRESLFKHFCYAIGNKNGFFYKQNKEIENRLENVREAEKLQLDTTSTKVEGLRKGIIAHITAYKQYEYEEELIFKEKYSNEEAEKKGDERSSELLLLYGEALEELNVDEMISYWRNFVVDQVAASNQMTAIHKVDKSELKIAADRISSRDYPHFAGCEPIEKVQIKADGIYVKINKTLYDKLNEQTAEEKLVSSTGEISFVRIPLGEYQLTRLYEALENIEITIGGLKIPIYLSFGMDDKHRYAPNYSYKSRNVV